MDVSDITPELEQLDVDLDKLQEALQPLLGDVGDISSKLPLLDKAKLYVLVSYALESIIFCEPPPRPFHVALRLLMRDTASLRLNGVDTKNHAIVKELTRVKQYFEKIQKIETPPSKPENTLNTEAAIRFLRTNLVGQTVS